MRPGSHVISFVGIGAKHDHDTRRQWERFTDDQQDNYDHDYERAESDHADSNYDNG